MPEGVGYKTNLGITVPQSVIDEIKQMGMERALQKAQEPGASDVFKEGVRRMYKFSDYASDYTSKAKESQSFEEGMPSGAGGGSPDIDTGGTLGSGSPRPNLNREAITRGLLARQKGVEPAGFGPNAVAPAQEQSVGPVDINFPQGSTGARVLGGEPMAEQLAGSLPSFPEGSVGARLAGRGEPGQPSVGQEMMGQLGGALGSAGQALGSGGGAASPGGIPIQAIGRLLQRLLGGGGGGAPMAPGPPGQLG